MTSEIHLLVMLERNHFVNGLKIKTMKSILKEFLKMN